MDALNANNDTPIIGWSRRGRWLRWAGTLLSIGLFVWLLSQQDWRAAWQTLTGLPWENLLLAGLLYILYYLAGSLRWYILLRSQAIAIPYLETFKIVLSGGYASNFLPSTVGGDGVRMLSIRRFTENWTAGVTTVVMDRLVGLAAMLSFIPLFFTTFGSFGDFINGLSSSHSPGIATAPVWATRLGGWIKGTTSKVWETVRVWLHRPGTVGLALVAAWVSRGVTFFAIWSLAIGLGIEVSLYQVIGISAFTYFLTLLPISINGYGLRELSVTSLYVLLGASLEQGTALAVITRFIALLETLPGALWLPEILGGTRSPDSAL